MDLLEFLFPASCLGCHKRVGSYFCSECVEKCRHPWLVCPECGKLSPIGQTHDDCLTVDGLDGLIGLYKYRGAIKKLINTLRYRYATKIVKDLISPCVSTLKILPSLKSHILVPIYPFRVQEMKFEFNQNILLARQIANELGWEFSTKVLEYRNFGLRLNRASNSKGMRNNRGEYAVNMANLASVSNPEAVYLLFSDTWSDSANLKQACRALKKSGVKKVWGLVIAK